MLAFGTSADAQPQGTHVGSLPDRAAGKCEKKFSEFCCNNLGRVRLIKREVILG
jgi:hypothetical protein